MYENYIKRIIDFSLALALLIISLPVAMVVAIAIKFESDGPALFTQNRTGRGGKAFKLFKFRSMAHGNDVRDLSKKDHITTLGKILRTTSLDEIPQLINVLKGDMSFIGPRPWIPEYHSHMSKKQRRRSAVRPGITGLAQAKGRNGLTINQKIAFDLKYVDNVSLMHDIKIILITIKTLFDTSTHAIGKHGIRQELETLRRQNKELT